MNIRNYLISMIEDKVSSEITNIASTSIMSTIKNPDKSFMYGLLMYLCTYTPNYMKKIYPGDTKDAIEVFRLYEAQGEYFDISNPSNIVRDTITIGKTEAVQTGYFIGKECIGCKLCYSVCPQKCIDISSVPVTINQNHCLHCGRCAEICPKQCIEKRG